MYNVMYMYMSMCIATNSILGGELADSIEKEALFSILGTLIQEKLFVAIIDVHVYA